MNLFLIINGESAMRVAEVATRSLLNEEMHFLMKISSDLPSFVVAKVSPGSTCAKNKCGLIKTRELYVTFFVVDGR